MIISSKKVSEYKMKNKKGHLPEKTSAEKIMDIFDLPKNKSGIVTALHITGTYEVMVEGHKGIIKYTDEMISINCPQFIMKINGENLEITSVADEYITIKGRVAGVEYVF